MNATIIAFILTIQMFCTSHLKAFQLTHIKAFFITSYSCLLKVIKKFYEPV